MDGIHFDNQGAKEWNVLDNFIKDAAFLNDFKMLIKTWNGEQGNCSYCYVCIIRKNVTVLYVILINSLMMCKLLLCLHY